MNYVILSVEATSKEDDKMFKSEIIQINAIKVSSNKDIVDKFSVIIKPTINPTLSDICKTATGINQEIANKGLFFKGAITELRKWIGQDPYHICTWGTFDIKQMEQQFRKNNLSIKWIKENHINIKKRHAEKVLHDRPIGVSQIFKKVDIKPSDTGNKGLDAALDICNVFIFYFNELKQAG